MAIPNKIERYYPVPIELANSLAFRSLSNRAKVLWHDLMMQYNGNNNGNINATLGGLKHYGWRSSSTLADALAQLIAHGFLCETRKGGGNNCRLQQCCLYRFTHRPVNANEKIGIKGGAATYDYRQYDPKRMPDKPTLTQVKGLSIKNSSFGIRSVSVRNSKREASKNEVHENHSLQNAKHGEVRKIHEIANSKAVAVNS